MNRMPGFTADAAVYASETSYRLVAGASGSNGDSGVIPSFAGPKSRGCIPGCICTTAEGCPCCDTIYKSRRAPAFRARIYASADAGAGSLAEVLDAWCTAHGGGMQSMSDGTVQCNL